MQTPLLKPGFYAVFLENMRSHVKLGVLAHETRPQAVSFSIAAIVRRIGRGDGIEDVVDYNHLRETVMDEAIIEMLRVHPSVYGVMVETRKLTVYDDAEAVGCTMARIDQEALA